MRPTRLAPLLLAVGCAGEFLAPELSAVGKPAAPLPPGPVVPAPIPTACTAVPSPGPAPVRRMTRREYDNTVRDLLGDDSRPAAGFNAEEEALGFANNAQALSTSSALVEKQLDAAEGIAARVVKRLDRLGWYRCAPATEGEAACARRFIEAFGPRAYRRPLSIEELDALGALYTQGRVLGEVDVNNTPLDPLAAGLAHVVAGALMTPDFLYRLEFDAQGAGSPVAVEPWALAARLSYLLWGSQPDEALRDAVARGELSTPAQLSAQAQRMLEDPRARATVVEFHEQWLDFSRVRNVGKAQSVYPTWSADIAALMEQETAGFIEQVVFDGEGTYDALLTAPYSKMNAPLAQFYGVDFPGAGQAFGKVALDPRQRAGLLTQGTLLSLNAHSNQTSPVHRGKLIREAFLCDVLAAPPASVNITVPEPTATTTARERFAQHSNDPSCSGCHVLMDPLGFGFENFDGIGRWRTQEGTSPVDARGKLVGTDVDGPFEGASDLAARLAASKRARGCYVKQWFRFAYGRGEVAADACTVERLQKGFEASGRDIRALVLGLTQSDAFLLRQSGATP